MLIKTLLFFLPGLRQQPWLFIYKSLYFFKAPTIMQRRWVYCQQHATEDYETWYALQKFSAKNVISKTGGKFEIVISTGNAATTTAIIRHNNRNNTGHRISLTRKCETHCVAISFTQINISNEIKYFGAITIITQI